MNHAIPMMGDYRTDSLVVVNEKGKLRRIYTPFRVLCFITSGNISKNTWVYVTQISANDKRELLYLIGEDFHVFDSFRIYINF